MDSTTETTAQFYTADEEDEILHLKMKISPLFEKEFMI